MRVVIGKTSWSVFVVDDIADAIDAASGKTAKTAEPELVGYTDVVQKLIFLQRKKSAQQLASTYLHELLHAICPEMSEKRAYHLERVLFRLLWKDGWRPSVLYK